MITVFFRDEDVSVPPTYEDGLLVDWFHGSEASTLDTNVIRSMFLRVGRPTPAAYDWFVLSALVYAADRCIQRSFSTDGWTRSIHLSFSVHDAGTWRACAGDIAGLLRFLTGDAWEISIRQRHRRMQIPSGSNIKGVERVCLLSGGLDSAAFAIEDALHSPNQLFVGHAESAHAVMHQNDVVRAVGGLVSSGCGPLVQVRVRPAGPSDQQRRALPPGLETTTRSRSLLFLSLAALAASAFADSTRIILPENGFLQINSPLTTQRLGSCTTRTAHPFFLRCLQTVWLRTGISHEIVTPYADLTKGEVLERCPDREILSSVWPKTMSCAHAAAGRYQGSTYGHCGYCYPCLVRRAALHRVGWDDGSDYRVDVTRDGDDLACLRHSTHGEALRAFLRALSDWSPGRGSSLRAVLRSGHVPGDRETLLRLCAVYDRGMEEVRSFLAAKCSPAQLIYAGPAVHSRNVA